MFRFGISSATFVLVSDLVDQAGGVLVDDRRERNGLGVGVGGTIVANSTNGVATSSRGRGGTTTGGAGGAHPRLGLHFPPVDVAVSHVEAAAAELKFTAPASLATVGKVAVGSAIRAAAVAEGRRDDHRGGRSYASKRNAHEGKDGAHGIMNLFGIDSFFFGFGNRVE